MSWYNNMTVEVDRDDVAKDFAQYIDDNGPYYVLYNGHDCYLVLIQHKEPAPLDLVEKAIQYQLDNLVVVREILADYLRGPLEKDADRILDKLGNIEATAGALKREWVEAYKNKEGEE